MTTKEYPTNEELEVIKTWDFSKRPVKDFLAFIESVWHWPDWGYELTGKRILRLELHTGGWSGNENIIAAIEENFVFWIMCWEKSLRGGHYYFKIRLEGFKK